jgi:hypothetical protein
MSMHSSPEGNDFDLPPTEARSELPGWNERSDVSTRDRLKQMRAISGASRSSGRPRSAHPGMELLGARGAQLGEEAARITSMSRHQMR